MAEYKDFSSLPADMEAAFVPFEERLQVQSSKAMNIGRILGAVTLVVFAIIIFSFPAPKKKNLITGEEVGKEPAPTVITGEDVPAEKPAEVAE